MPFFYCVPAIFMVNLIVAHSRLEDLFTLDSSDLSLDAFSDDASSFWSADENTSGFISLASNDLDQDPSFMSDINSLSSSNNLFASNSPDSTALFSCESEGSQLDGFLQARDGSCPPQENFNLDLQLFQDPEGYLRDNINVPPKGQMNQPGQEGKQDENRYMDFLTTNFKEDEEKCPTATYGSSNIPVCRNPFTGRMEYEPSSFAVTLYNALPCKPLHFAICAITILGVSVVLADLLLWSQIPPTAFDIQCCSAAHY